MNTPCTLRLIAISLDITFKREPSLYPLYLPPCRLLTCLQSHVPLCIFVSSLANSRCFLLMHREFEGDVRLYTFYLIICLKCSVVVCLLPIYIYSFVLYCNLTHLCFY